MVNSNSEGLSERDLTKKIQNFKEECSKTLKSILNTCLKKIGDKWKWAKKFYKFPSKNLITRF